jgi:hypothetical protein
MAEIRTVTTLKRKRDEISASIRMYEKKIAQARADMAHVAPLWEATGMRRSLLEQCAAYLKPVACPDNFFSF